MARVYKDSQIHIWNLKLGSHIIPSKYLIKTDVGVEKGGKCMMKNIYQPVHLPMRSKKDGIVN